MFGRHSRRLAFVIATVALLTSTFVASAASPDRTTVTLGRIPGGMAVEGSSSTLLRTDTGITMTIHTSGLDPHAVHTVWWVIFNNP